MRKQSYKLGKSRFYSPKHDVLGSYTGTSMFETPEQDADDL